MEITGVSSGSNPNPAGILRGRGNQARQQMHELGAALKLGDLTGAKAALSALQKQLQAAGPAGPRATLSPGGRNQVGTDLETLDKALQAGDLASARDAFKQVGKDMRPVGMPHHHAAQADAALSTGGGTSSFALPGGAQDGPPGGSGVPSGSGDRMGTTGKTIDITA